MSNVKRTGKIVTPQPPSPRPVYEVAVVVVPRPNHPEKFTNTGAAADEFGGERWYWECGRKVAFQTKDDAEKVRHENRNRYFKKGKGPIRVYECDWCDWFHIGHARKQE